MPLGNHPPPSPGDHPSPSPSSPTFPANSASRPPLRGSSSNPESTDLTVPLEQLSLQDHEEFMRQQQQRIPQSQAFTLRDPTVTFAQERAEEHFDQSMVHHMNTGKGKEKDIQQNGSHLENGHARDPRPRLSSAHPALQRPDLPHRNSSFSKRHASFDTPREVPLPYMPHSHNLSYSSTSNAPTRPHADTIGDGEPVRRVYAPFDQEHPAGVGPAADHTGSASSSTGDGLPSASCSSSPTAGPTLARVDTPMDTRGGPCTTSNLYFTEASTGMSLSTSPAQFPLLQQRTSNKGPSSPVHPFSRPYSSPNPVGSRQVPLRIHSPQPMRPSGMPDRSSTASLPLPAHTPYHILPSISGTIDEDRDMGEGSARSPQPPNCAPSSSGSTSESVSTPSSSAPIPATAESSLSGPRSTSLSTGSSWLHERSASPPFSHFLERAFSSSYFPMSCAQSPSPSTLPPPAPPVVLTPPPPPLSEGVNERAPHEPFLAHAPAPNDSYIAVETNPREYRLLVRLPGFRRDGITLSTRKRRILHVVADSWEPDGGHFERRISFGYDADLAQVRAEFDGEFLRVIIPRRNVPGAASWNLRE